VTILTNFIDFQKMLPSAVARVTFGSRSFIRASKFFPIIILCIVVVDSEENIGRMFYMDSGLVPLFV